MGKVLFSEGDPTMDPEYARSSGRVRKLSAALPLVSWPVKVGARLVYCGTGDSYAIAGHAYTVSEVDERIQEVRFKDLDGTDVHPGHDGSQGWWDTGNFRVAP